MKVKAVVVDESCEYVTEGKVYDAQNTDIFGFGYIIDDVGDNIYVYLSGNGECGHGVKWEIAE